MEECSESEQVHKKWASFLNQHRDIAYRLLRVQVRVEAEDDRTVCQETRLHATTKTKFSPRLTKGWRVQDLQRT